MNRFFIIITLAILVIFGIQSCKKSKNEDTVFTYRVAVLAEGTTFNDMAFLQSCKDGIERAKDAFGLEVEYNIDTTHKSISAKDQ